jgi:hypothetical protein
MAGSGDRRSAERMPVVSGTNCSFAGRVIEDVGPVRIQDVSLEGIGLILVRRVEVGVLLSIGLANPPRGIDKAVLVRVAHVTAVPGGFHVGGVFTAPLTYQELTSLVM